MRMRSSGAPVRSTEGRAFRWSVAELPCVATRAKSGTSPRKRELDVPKPVALPLTIIAHTTKHKTKEARRIFRRALRVGGTECESRSGALQPSLTLPMAF